MLYLLLPSLRCGLRSRADLLLEIAALRQQVAVLQRHLERPRLSRKDREVAELVARAILGGLHHDYSLAA